MSIRSIALGVVVAAALTFPASATIISTFDNDAEGWGTLNDATNFHWTDALGNPPGAIRATDQTAGLWWYFSASDAYLGDMSSYYGGELSWDIMLINGNNNDSGTRADVMLVGGGMSIGLNADVDPVNGQWTSWSATFDTSQSWRHINQLTHGTLSSTVVTEAQFQAVLSDLTGLYIRGEYTVGADAAALDNVMLTSLPAPGALALFGFGLLGISRRQRAV